MLSQEAIYKMLPHYFQNMVITLFDYLQYRRRHGSRYVKFKKELKDRNYKELDELKVIQNDELVSYLSFCKDNSPYYAEVLEGIDVDRGMDILKDIPICSKEDFRKNIPIIISGNKGSMCKSKTGGTTGKAMQVYFRWDDLQERFGIIDSFRERFGYKFGKRTAWFSGKDILTAKDLKRNRFWKQDWLYNIRYYSTFNIQEDYLIHYINDLKRYRPEFIVGFPSSVVEIARYGLRHNIDLGYSVKAVFPTAESKVKSEAADIIKFFGGGVYDQYASSEGACFITECEGGNLHFEMSSGVIEVVDDNYKPSKRGRMLITAFHTRGTPLIRYDIGDAMEWSDNENCSCGRQTPLVKAIYGRVNDYVYSRETGKCNLGNISNCIKYVNGVVKFQVVQDDVDFIKVLIVKSKEYTEKDEDMFLKELRYRLGESIGIEFDYVEHIEVEKSGKFRLVKNSIKNIIEQ